MLSTSAVNRIFQLENIRQAGIRAIQSNFTRYTAIGGQGSAGRNCGSTWPRTGLHYDISECVVNGGKHAIFNLCSHLWMKETTSSFRRPTGCRSAISRTMRRSRTIFVQTRKKRDFALPRRCSRSVHSKGADAHRQFAEQPERCCD